MDDLLLQVHGDMRKFEEIRMLLLRKDDDALSWSMVSDYWMEDPWYDSYYYDGWYEGDWQQGDHHEEEGWQGPSLV